MQALLTGVPSHDGVTYGLAQADTYFRQRSKPLEMFVGYSRKEPLLGVFVLAVVMSHTPRKSCRNKHAEFGRLHA